MNDVFVINLDRRPDRWASAVLALRGAGISQPRRVTAIDGRTLDIRGLKACDGSELRPGDVGCTRSHRSVAEIARAQGLPHYAVFEDDVTFVPGASVSLAEFLGAIPADWEIVYLGCTHQASPLMVSGRVRRVARAYTTHAMIIRDSVYDLVHSAWCRMEKVDLAIVDIQKRGKCYCPVPQIAVQAPGYSDINEGGRDSTKAFERFS